MQVLMVERHAQSRVLAGAHVFPGGCLEPGDSAPLLQRASTKLTPEAAAARLQENLPPATALAFWIAAIRELFEETGILLARERDRPLDLADPGRRARLEKQRTDLLDARLTFTELVRSESLQLATHELEYFGRWITPVTAPHRYDTRFFVAHLPPGQEPTHDRREITATGWLRPAEALERAQSGAMVLAPPTLRTLQELDELGTIASVMQAVRTRSVAPITPKLVEVSGCPAILYPGDADYELAVPGQPIIGATPGPHDRALMDGGGWRSIRSRRA